jgi:hypothetical protein
MSEHRTVQHDLPAEPHAESREETIERVVETDPATGGGVDPSTRRGVNFRLWRALTGWALAGAVIGAVAGVILSLAPGPFETGSVAGTVGYAGVHAVALAIVFSMIGSLITLEREDGRVERDVERRTGRG